jgi:hypothetical protein
MPPFTKTKVNGDAGLAVPMFTAPKFASGGAVTCGELTVMGRVIFVLNAPDVPLMAMFCVPVEALGAAVSVSRAVPVVGFGLKVAVTENGRPEAERLTLPVNPFVPVTVIVDVVDIPSTTDTDGDDALKLKPGPGTTVKTIGVDAVWVPDLASIVNE